MTLGLGILEFTGEELRRRHGAVEKDPLGGYRLWNAPAMFWELYDRDGKHLGNVCPDHERASGNPHYEALLDALRKRVT